MNNSLEGLALFGSMLGLINYEKNLSQQQNQEIMMQKLDRILSIAERLEKELLNGQKSM